MQAHCLLACSQVHIQLPTFLTHPRSTCLGWQCPQRAGPPTWIISQESAPAPDMSTGQSAELSLPHLFQPKLPLSRCVKQVDIARALWKGPLEKQPCSRSKADPGAFQWILLIFQEREILPVGNPRGKTELLLQYESYPIFQAWN